MNISSFVQNASLNQYWTKFNRAASTSLSPWSGIILATSATALVGLGVYHWSRDRLSDEAVNDHLTDDAQERIKRTYAYVFGGFALTAASAVVSHVAGLSFKMLISKSAALPIGLTLASIASLITTLAVSKENTKIKHIAWACFNITMGMALSPLIIVNQAVLAQAALISLGVGGILTLTVFMSPDREFIKWEAPLLVALASLSIASSIAYFFPRTAFAYGIDRASLYGGLAIFTGLFMASTQRLIKEAQTQTANAFDAINSSLNIYLDWLNIFIRLFRILDENRERV